MKNFQSNATNRISNVIVSVDRMERGENSPLSALHKLEKTFGVKIHPIVTFDDIVHALEAKVIGGTEYLEAMKCYKERYGGY